VTRCSDTDILQCFKSNQFQIQEIDCPKLQNPEPLYVWFAKSTTPFAFN